MDLPISIPLHTRNNTNPQTYNTEFDEWVKTTVTKAVKKHLKPSDFPGENKFVIQIRATGSHEGVFYILIDKTKNTPENKIIVEPYNYNNYDINIDGDSSIIIKLLKKRTVLLEEIENENIKVDIKNNQTENENITDDKIIESISYNFKPGIIYSFLKTNLYSNSNFTLFVISISCFLCGVLSILISNDVIADKTQYASGILFGLGLVSFPLISRSSLDKLSEVISNIAILFLTFSISFFIFYDLYNDYSCAQTTYSSLKYAFMIISLFIACLCVCYVISFAVYKFWTFFNQLFKKLFAFKKTEDSENYKLQIRNEILLKLCAIITTIFTIVATATPVISSVIKLFSK